jgi:hypothetical protein
MITRRHVLGGGTVAGIGAWAAGVLRTDVGVAQQSILKLGRSRRVRWEDVLRLIEESTVGAEGGVNCRRGTGREAATTGKPH